MSTVITMPQLTAGGNLAVIQTWTVAAGAEIVVGQVLAEIETEKAIIDLEAQASGIFAGVLVPEGAEVPVGDPIAVIADAGEDLEAALGSVPGRAGAAAGAPKAATAAADSAQQTGAGAEASGSSPAADTAGRDRIFASPLVRRLIRDHDLSLAELTGSGPSGRIVRRDVEAFLANRPDTPVAAAPTPSTQSPSTAGATLPGSTPDAGYTDIPHSGMRKAIARRLSESKSTIPHFYVTRDVRMDALMDLRRQINALQSVKVSVNDLVIKGVAHALRDVPAANAIWSDTAMRRFDSIDVAVAVAVDEGLLTPVVRDLASKTVTQISLEVSELAERARAGRLRQEEIEGGAFAVSNLGMFGVREFSAIINPPQSGILAIGAAERRAVVAEDGSVEAATVMTVTLSADHRILDGVVAAQWLAAFAERMENPLTILV